MLKQLYFLILFYPIVQACQAQQWIEKKYDYDTTLNVYYGSAFNFLGESDSLFLDIYSPICDDANSVSTRPLIVFFHGGAFLAGDKQESGIRSLCQNFAERGYVAVSVNYRLGFVSDNTAWSCNYPDYSCIFAADSAEWYRAYYRSVQDGKGALRYLMNRHDVLRLDPENIFLAGESAGSFIAFGVGLLDTLAEKPIEANSLSPVPKPNENTLNCVYNKYKTFPDTIPRPDLGSIEGLIEPGNIPYTVKGIGNFFGGMMNDLLQYHPVNQHKPAIFSFHQPCDLVVPIDSGKIYWGLTWCMTNGYNCYGIAHTPKIFGSRAISSWNAVNNYGYTIHNEYTTTEFPYNFLFGTGSCLDQVNYPCHGYDNSSLRTTNLALYFAPLVSTNPICDTGYSTALPSFPKKESVLFYPNPASTELTIELEDNHNFTLSMYNVLGIQSIPPISFEQKKTIVNIQSLPSGVYYLHFLDKSKGTFFVKKMTKF